MEKFGRLTVVRYIKKPSKINPKHNKNFAEVSCVCGNKKVVSVYSLRNGNTKSCGCIQKEWAKNAMIKMNTTHGYGYHPLAVVWHSMKNRCFWKKDKGYHNYGGRGIIICDEWINNPKLFFDWALNNGYQKGLTIDRINNNGNYEPMNCRWVSLKINTRNTRFTKLSEMRARHIRILYKRCNKNQSVIAKMYGVDQAAISRVISNQMWA